MSYIPFIRTCLYEIWVTIYTSYELFEKRLALREKCLYSKCFWSVFSHLRTDYWEILRIPTYSVRMLENTDNKNSEHVHVLLSVFYVEVMLFYKKLCNKPLYERF